MMHTSKILAAGCVVAALSSCSSTKQSPDLTLYELCGQVKEVTIDYQSVDKDKNPLDEPYRLTITFDKEGTLLTEDTTTFSKEDFKRDDQGRLIELQNNKIGEVVLNETRSYTYSSDKAQPDTIFTRISGEYSYSTTLTNTYDADGNLLSSHSASVFDGNMLESDYSYSILESDAQGNWTKRFATITETEQLLDENCELGAPTTQVRYTLETRYITYWDGKEQNEAPALADGDDPAEEEPSIFDDCYDKRSMQELVYYVALRDTKGHESPDASSPTVDEQFYGKGSSVMAESGATSFSEYDSEWYEWSWRGESYYFKRSDFERMSLQVCSRLATSFINPGKMMWFQAADGSTITLSILDKNGHKFHALDEGSAEVMNLNVGEQVYIMQYGGEYGSEPYVLNEEDGFVSLCGMGSYISRTKGDVNDCEGVVINGQLTCDAWHTIFPDPDFSFETYYVPSEQALMLNGTLYHFLKEEDME